jgi:glyoxylase I family protein
LEYLRNKGVAIMGEPTLSKSFSEGQKWVYFTSPWGMQFELVSFPNGKAYEATAATKLWHPAHPEL